MIKISTMDVQKTLGKNIKRHRLFKGIKGDAFAEKIGLSPEHLSKLENADETAKNIGLKYLVKIAQELNVPIEELFMKNPEEVVVKFTLAENNLEAFRKLLGRAEYLLQIKKQKSFNKNK